VSVAADGRRLVYATFTQSSNVWSLPIPASGVTGLSRAEPVTTGAQLIEIFDISPDGRWLAFDSDRGGTPQLYRMPLTGNGEVEQLTSGVEPAFAPAISPDGREIAYHAFRHGTRQVFVIPAEGGPPIQVTTGSGQYQNVDWSPDGQSLAVAKGYRTPAQEVVLVTRDQRGRWGAPRTLLKGGMRGIWSPEGRSVLTAMGVVGALRTLAVASVAAGGETREVLGVRDPATDVAPSGFDGWVWAVDGRAIYFVGRDPRNQQVGVWRLPAAGGMPRPVLRFDDPTHRWHRSTGLRVHGGRFYLNLGDQQSDLWMAEIADSESPDSP
jgi:dipeptidyl aminopeptidase/acylaminoacyl peptidase